VEETLRVLPSAAPPGAAGHVGDDRSRRDLRADLRRLPGGTQRDGALRAGRPHTQDPPEPSSARAASSTTTTASASSWRPTCGRNTGRRSTRCGGSRRCSTRTGS
jgi:hypothetical protein